MGLSAFSYGLHRIHISVEHVRVYLTQFRKRFGFGTTLLKSLK